MTSSRTTEPIMLPSGLVLRTAEARDLEQIGVLLAERGEQGDALDHQLVVEDSPGGWQSCAVVVDGDRVVSTATLLDESLTLGGIQIPAGQVELVATDRQYEGRGLVRALMDWAHQRSAELGHIMQVMIGIPYFYRQFGYVYSIDIPSRRVLSGDLPSPAADEKSCRVRVTTAQDIPELTALNDEAAAESQLRMPHQPECWRWILAQDASTTWIVESAGGQVLASGRTTPPDDEVLLAEVTARSDAAAWALLRHASTLATEELRVAVRQPVTTMWEALLEPAGPGANQYYTRIPDTAALLDLLRPVFEARLAAAGIALADVPDGKVIVSTFRQHFVLPVVGDSFGPVVTGGPMQAPGVHSAAGIAPDLIGSVLFGPHGLDGLSRRHPDVYADRGGELMRTLFPPVTSDLLTYYLP